MSFYVIVICSHYDTRGLMTSLRHDYVSGTPTTSMASWLKKLFTYDQFHTSYSSFGVVVLFSLVLSELNNCV